MIEDLRQIQYENVRLKQKKRIKKVFLSLAVFILTLCTVCAVTALYWSNQNRHFVVTHYDIFSDKVEDSIRAVVLSDLHSCEYGENNSGLIQKVEELEPDMILMLGDMLNQDHPDADRLLALCRELLKTAPVYFVNGNHEGEIINARLDSIPLNDMLKEIGVKVLIHSMDEFKKGATTVRLIGVSTNKDNYDKWSRDRVDSYLSTDDYKIFLSHYPSLYYEKLRDLDVDLALAGHYHGGLIRIPGIGGLYHPEGGLFPKYDGGIYQLTNAKLIVSRGIGGHGTIPRINNVPELVVVDIKKPES